jgi:hypothetical protein
VESAKGGRILYACTRRARNAVLNYRDFLSEIVFTHSIRPQYARSLWSIASSRITYLLLRLNALPHVIATYHVLPAERADRLLLILAGLRQATASVRPYLNSLGQICTVTIVRKHPGDYRPWQPHLLFGERKKEERHD